MAKRRFINVVVAPEDRSGTLNFRIRLSHFYALAVAVSVAFVVVVGLVMNQAMDEAKLGELELLRHQNADLKKKVERIAVVEKKITDLEVVEDKLMVMAGERAANRELSPVSVDASNKGAAGKPVNIADGLREFRALLLARRGILLGAPAGDPVVNGWVARGFGETGLEGASFHSGVDIATPEGTPVAATAPGVVIFAGNDPVYGKLVIVQHGLTGYSTFYGHNKELKVKAGDTVKRGDVVALAGSTGRSSAPHLHYEVRMHGVPVNAAKYITPAETGGEAEALPAPVTAETAANPPTAEKKSETIPSGNKTGSAEGPGAPAPPEKANP